MCAYMGISVCIWRSKGNLAFYFVEAGSWLLCSSSECSRPAGPRTFFPSPVLHLLYIVELGVYAKVYCAFFSPHFFHIPKLAGWYGTQKICLSLPP